MADFVTVELEHAGTLLAGKAALPEGSGPFPAVLVMHNALGIGERIHQVLRSLAALGYVAVASDMYGGGAPAGDPEITSGAPFQALMADTALLRDRIVAWYDRVATMPEVKADRVAAIGYCFGGTCVLELARSGAPARAVISYHGILTSAQPMQPGVFAGEVQAWCGAHDPFAPLDHVEGLRSELTSAGAHHTITTFGDAAHGFTDPGSDALGMEGIAYNAMADRVSWAGTIALLDAELNG